MTVVTLIDGRQVDSYSEDWRHECEARDIVRGGDLAARRQRLAGIQKARGKPAADRLRETIKAIWAQREPA